MRQDYIALDINIKDVCERIAEQGEEVVASTIETLWFMMQDFQRKKLRSKDGCYFSDNFMAEFKEWYEDR